MVKNILFVLMQQLESLEPCKMCLFLAKSALEKKGIVLWPTGVTLGRWHSFSSAKHCCCSTLRLQGHCLSSPAATEVLCHPGTCLLPSLNAFSHTTEFSFGVRVVQERMVTSGEQVNAQLCHPLLEQFWGLYQKFPPGVFSRAKPGYWQWWPTD